MKMFTLITMIILVLSLSLFSNGKDDRNVNDKMAPAGAMMMAPSENLDEKSDGPIRDFVDMSDAMMLSETQPTVLFFYASWCPTCQAAEKDFEANKSEFENINLLRVDYDHSADLQKKYGVTYQHTFVQVSPQGEAMVTWNGGATEELLKKIIKKEM